MDDNPFESPSAKEAWRRSPHAITFRRALGVIVGCSLALGVLGGAIGSCLGAVAPDYYLETSRFGIGDFDPIQLGLGLGVTQGAAGGVVVGLLLVAVLAWYDLRKDAQRRPE